MEILLEDMAHKLQAPVTLPVDPRAQTFTSTSKAQDPTETSTPAGNTSRPPSPAVQSSYSSPDTPPPSPPVATSPSPHLVREMSSLSLLGEEKVEDREMREKPKKGCDDPMCIDRIENWGKSFTGPSVRATNLKRRSGGIQAGG